MTGRIVVPIHNVESQLVAYAGRWPGTPQDEDTPKYKLPPGFRKTRELFNSHRAIREPDTAPLVVVEGFFDALALWQEGIRRVVALWTRTNTRPANFRNKSSTRLIARIVKLFPTVWVKLRSIVESANVPYRTDPTTTNQ